MSMGTSPSRQASLPELLAATAHLKRALHNRLTLPLRDADLTASQWLMLCYLRRHECDTLTGVAERIGHDTGAMSRVVHALCQRGLVKAERPSTDRRSVRLSITPTGATLCAAIEHTIAPSIDSPTERQLAQLLHILADLMASCTSALRIDDNFPNAAA
ncbi:MarR family winged helix-turn-helix transcriptional regulator [Cupriavidus necator]|uniref:MarR family winged helix-turn-helix transcriptional regulator n=1 Tax=Cupriavidus necator TaxID=106590 RepID=UPI0009B7F960|nr:MarR family transcriptional regulator [Cupriavidus necator]